MIVGILESQLEIITVINQSVVLKSTTTLGEKIGMNNCSQMNKLNLNKQLTNSGFYL